MDKNFDFSEVFLLKNDLPYDNETLEKYKSDVVFIFEINSSLNK